MILQVGGVRGGGILQVGGVTGGGHLRAKLNGEGRS